MSVPVYGTSPSTTFFGLTDASAARLLTLDLSTFDQYLTYVPFLPDTLVSPNTSSVFKLPSTSVSTMFAFSPASDIAFIHRLTSTASLPTRASPASVGYDLYSPLAFTIPPNSHITISTGLQIIPPMGTYIRLAGRSGLASSSGLLIGAGVVDPDYRGQIKVVLFNLSPTPVSFQLGDRFAQLIFERCSTPLLHETSHPLPPSVRNANGFGSSGGFSLQSSPSASHSFGFSFFTLCSLFLTSFSQLPVTSCSSEDEVLDLANNDVIFDETENLDSSENPLTQPHVDPLTETAVRLSQPPATPPQHSTTPDSAQKHDTPSPDPESQLESLDLDDDDSPHRLVTLQFTPPAPPTWASVKPRAKPKVTPDRSQHLPPIVLTFPSRQLAEVGLFAHYLILCPSTKIQPSFNLKRCLSLLEDAYRRDEGVPCQRPFAFVPLSSSTFDPKRRIAPTAPDPKAAVSGFLSATANLFSKSSADQALYTRYDTTHAPVGYHIRILTPTPSKKALSDMCPSKCHVSIFQPQDIPPDVLPCLRSKPTDRFYQIGWLLFSSRHISTAELSMVLELHLHQVHPTWIWFPRLVKVHKSAVATLDRISDQLRTTALWISICDATLLPEIDHDLRTLFSKPSSDRPLGRLMHYIPRDIFPSIRNPDQNTSDTQQWNNFVLWQSIYWEQAEQFCQYTTHDPYETLSDLQGHTTTTRALALSLDYKPPGSTHPSRLFAGFERHDNRPYPSPHGILRSHIPVPISTFDFDRHVRDYATKESALLLPTRTQRAFSPDERDSDYKNELYHSALAQVRRTDAQFPTLQFRHLAPEAFPTDKKGSTHKRPRNT